MFPILNRPPSSLPIPSLWVIPVHQPQASSIVHRTWTGDSFHIWYYTYFNAILPNHPTLSLSHRVQKTVLYINVSFAVSYTGLLFKLLTPRREERLTWIKGRSVSSIIAPQHILPKKYLSLGFFFFLKTQRRAHGHKRRRKRRATEIWLSLHCCCLLPLKYFSLQPAPELPSSPSPNL